MIKKIIQLVVIEVILLQVILVRNKKIKLIVVTSFLNHLYFFIFKDIITFVNEVINLNGVMEIIVFGVFNINDVVNVLVVNVIN